MLDYKKAYDAIEKKLADCWEKPYSEENYDKISKYIKDLYHLKHLMCYKEEMPIMHHSDIVMHDMSNKSEFEKIVYDILKKHPEKETVQMLIKEFDSIAMMMKSLHPQRYSEFLNKLKEIR